MGWVSESDSESEQKKQKTAIQERELATQLLVEVSAASAVAFRNFGANTNHSKHSDTA
jgi:hypothetical protein